MSDNIALVLIGCVVTTAIINVVAIAVIHRMQKGLLDMCIAMLANVQRELMDRSNSTKESSNNG